MAVNIPQFRYLDGYKTYVANLKTDINELTQLVEQQQKLLASSMSATTNLSAAATNSFTINITDQDADAKSRMRRLAKKIDPDLVKIVVPNKEALEAKYALTEELYEKYRTLEAVESQVSTRFAGPTSEPFRKELVELKRKVGKSLEKALTFISDLAHKHVPKSFQKYMDAVSAEIDEHVSSQHTETFLYLSTTAKGSLVFTYYKMMENAINDDGTVTPVMYIVVQWLVGSQDEEPQMLVYLIHNYETPNTLLLQGGGTPVSSAMTAVKAVAHLLALEHFSSELGVVPLSLAFLRDPATINKSLFSIRDLVTKLEIHGTSITFTINKKVPAADYGKLATELYPQVKSLLKKQRTARLRQDVKPGKRTITYTSVGLSGPLDITLQDAEFFKERFGATDQQLRKIVHLLNNP